MIRALIADDERAARLRIRALLGRDADVQVVAECKDGPETVERVGTLAPDVAFLDVQMPGLTGLEVADALAQAGTDPPPLVVLVTAHDDFAIRAFDVDAVDYLLKPVADDRFDATMRRVRARLESRNAESISARLEQLLDRSGKDEPPDRLVERSARDVTLIPTGDIRWVEASGDYAKLHTADRVHLVRSTMDAMERRLGDAYARIHRSTIVRLDQVRKLRAVSHGDYVVELADGTRLRLSRRYRDAISQRLHL